MNNGGKKFNENRKLSIETINEDYYYSLNISLIESLESRRANSSEENFLEEELARLEKYLTEGIEETIIYKRLIIDTLKNEPKVFGSEETLYTSILGDLKYYYKQYRAGAFQTTENFNSYIAKALFDYRDYLRDISIEEYTEVTRTDVTPLTEIELETSIGRILLLKETGFIDLLVKETGKQPVSKEIIGIIRIITGINPRTIAKNIALGYQTLNKGTAQHNNARSAKNLKEVRHILDVAGYKAESLKQLDKEIKDLESRKSN